MYRKYLKFLGHLNIFKYFRWSLNRPFGAALALQHLLHPYRMDENSTASILYTPGDGAMEPLLLE